MSILLTHTLALALGFVGGLVCYHQLAPRVLALAARIRSAEAALKPAAPAGPSATTQP